jgi:hypothetical protein
VGVVGCLVIVREQLFAVIVDESVFCVKLELKVVFELITISALVVHVTQTRLVERFGLESKYFVVKSLGELLVPVRNKLSVSGRQRCDELVVAVEPIIHTIVTNQRLLTLSKSFHN